MFSARKSTWRRTRDDKACCSCCCRVVGAEPAAHTVNAINMWLESTPIKAPSPAELTPHSERARECRGCDIGGQVWAALNCETKRCVLSPSIPKRQHLTLTTHKLVRNAPQSCSDTYSRQTGGSTWRRRPCADSALKLLTQQRSRRNRTRWSTRRHWERACETET